MDGIDKVWAPLAGRPLVWHAMSRLAGFANETVLVVRPGDEGRAKTELSEFAARIRVVAGGATRQESAACGIGMLGEVGAIAIHDAARPLATAKLLQRGLALLELYDGAVPVQPLPDTIKQVNADGIVEATVDRTTLRAAQTPQLFRASVLRAAIAQAAQRGWEATDEAALVERAGGVVATFPGEASNYKITTPADLSLARVLVEATGAA